MLIYRPQRGSLDDAMKESKEFKDEAEMKEHIVSKVNNLFFADMMSVEDIVINTKTFNDARIGWRDTRLVCTKRSGTTLYDTPKCIGMCATDYDKPRRRRANGTVKIK